MSCASCSSRIHDHNVRVSSRSTSTLPRSRRAADLASSSDSPSACRSPASSAIWNCSSSQSSSSLRRRCLHHVNFRKNEVIGPSSSSLIGRLQKQPHGTGEGVPFRLFSDQLLSPLRGDAVVTGALALLRELPRRVNPALGLEPIERRVERACFNLQQVFRSPLNVLRDGVSVTRCRQERAQNQEIERASHELDARRWFGRHCVERLPNF